MSVQHQNFSNNHNTSEDEIDLLQLAKTVWDGRRLVLKIVGTFIILGLIVALLSPKEFTASGTYLPQTSEAGKAGGSLSGLASLAGINLGGAVGGSEIPPTLYPKIVESVPFKLAMLNAPLKFEGLDQKVTYREYYEKYYSIGLLGYIKKYTIGLPGVIIQAIKGEDAEKVEVQDESGIISVSQADLKHFKRLANQTSVTFNEKDGFVELTAIMPEAEAAAQLAKYAEALLQKEVINFKIKNAQEQLKFTEARYFEKKKEFEQVQARLAHFQDRNRNISSSVALNQLDKLEAEYNLSFSVYSELAKQLEQAKLQVSKDTPVFSVIQPVTIPVEKSAPKQPLILVSFIVVGVIIALGIVFGKEYLTSIKQEWNR